jgi:hypothetical protein
MRSEVPKIRAHVRSVSTKDGLVILDVNTGKYYSLNRTGAVIWTGLERGLTKEELIAVVLETFNVPEDKLRADVDALLKRLSELRIIEKDSRPNSA